jgi:hypothetical protein
MTGISNLGAILQLKGIAADPLLLFPERAAVEHAIERLSWFAPAFHRQLLRDVPTETLQAEIDRRRAERGL